MDAKNDLFLVIAIVVILGIAWAFTGGPQRIISRQGPFLKPPEPLGTGEAYGRRVFFRDSSDSSSSPPADERSIKREIERAQEELERVQEELENIQKYGTASQYEESVTIAKRTSGPKAEDPNDEYILLTASRNNSDNILITGWQLESLVTKKRVTIGGGAPLFRSGIINSEPAIFLAPREEAVISTGRSPVGASFRINKCTGYFEQFQDFSPRLSLSCPSATDEFDQFAIPITDSICEDIVRSIRRCEMRTKALPIGSSSECSDFISRTLNYAGCVERHRNDTDFFGDEWRIFLGHDEELWRNQREIIRLLDREGKTVDVFSY
jgi:hypothetical protein